MNYTQFKAEIQSRIQNFLPEELQGYGVDIQPYIKNNGVVKDRLMIYGNESVSLPIYLEAYFESYRQGQSLESLLREMADVYEQHYAEALAFERESHQYDKIKNHLTVVACNAEMNEALLKNIPHERREDLALVYHIRKKGFEGGVKTVLVNNWIMDAWGIGQETLKEDAWKSMKTENAPCFRSMREFFGELFPGGELLSDLYFLTNQDEMHGAAYMFDVDTMGCIAEKLGKSLIVLPSSIHEIIIFPEENEVEVEEMQLMVRTINGTELRPEDILSDQVYRFDKDTQELSMLVSSEQTMGMDMRL